MVLPLIRRPHTPPWPSTTVICLLWIISIVDLSLVWYIKSATGVSPPWASNLRLLAQAGNVLITSLLTVTIGGLRILPPTVLGRAAAVSDDDQVTLFEWLTFTWVNRLIALGADPELKVSDLPTLSLTLRTTPIFEAYRQVKQKNLLLKLVAASSLDMIVDFSFTVASVFCNYAGPFFLKQILDGLTDRTPDALAKAYVYAVLAFLASALKGLVDVIHLWHARRASVRVKSELTAAIYDKALRRKDLSGLTAAKEDGKGEKSSADVGKIVNLMSSDATKISNLLSAGYFFYQPPFEITLAGIFLYRLMGWSAFAGLAVLVVSVPFNSVISKQNIKINQELMKARDKRIGIMSELVGAIQFIKFFAWIEQWKGRAADSRKKEMRQLIRSMINSVLFALLWNLTPILVTVVSFVAYVVVAQRELTVSIAFTAISLFTMVRMPLNTIPTFIVWALQTMVSVKRIDDFLQEPEVPDWVSSLKREVEVQGSRIGFENATLRWNKGEEKETKTKTPTPTPTIQVNGGDERLFQLSDLNVNFPAFKLTVITGPTGAGKSALLVALLGEMELLSGKTYLPKEVHQVDPESKLRNSIAFAAQTPWLQQKSIKDNILFGEPFDEARYDATLEACALQPDLDVLEDGDQTEIGHKGVSLSGGQKARVALARAVYSYTQHILLDDPLAAVDSHTAKHLVDKCLNGPLLSGRTVIIVSHHVELLLPVAGYIVRILDGRIDAQGTPSALRDAGELEGLVALEESKVEQQAVKVEAAEEEVVEPEKKEKKKGPGKKLVQDEDRPVGVVKWGTYKLYIKAATYSNWFWSIVALVFIQLGVLAERWWLKIWGEAYTTSFRPTMAVFKPVMTEYDAHQMQHHFIHTSRNISVEAIQLPSADANPTFYLGIYSSIVVGSALIGVLSTAIGQYGQYRAAVNLHDRLLDRMLRATVRFFNVTPVGRIINRFSRDIESLDTSLSQSLRVVISQAGNLVGALVMVAVIVPWFLVPAALISWAYWRYSVVYLRVGRSLRRLEATSRSPVYSGFGELLDGIMTVRAFGAEKRFMADLCEQVDKTNGAFYWYWMTNRWLLLRFDVLGAVSVLATTLFALSGTISPGSAGMAIISSQSFVSACYWMSRFWGSLEMDFNSVERVEEYLAVPQEPPAVIKGSRPPAYWPSSDAAQFLSVRDLEIKYAPDLPTVFKGSFEIKSGEKIGLIGRTGSGKSTLAMSLLRFSEPHSGSIWLDGIDITSIGVDDLRSRITYIPQDAVLFSGTVKENLDPFDEHTEDELLDALSRVNLGPSAAESQAPSRVPSSKRLSTLGDGDEAPTPPNGSNVSKATVTLTSEVSAGGANFSQGQRQLVAMARALLRRSNLIIMDEATASVDFATDEAIQRAIRTEFKSSTLLTIAHRLSSVIDYDRLLVLADGQIKEFDTPINLLKQDGSLFKQLCEKSGRFGELYKAAEAKEKGEWKA